MGDDDVEKDLEERSLAVHTQKNGGECKAHLSLVLFGRPSWPFFFWKLISIGMAMITGQPTSMNSKPTDNDLSP